MEKGGSVYKLDSPNKLSTNINAEELCSKVMLNPTFQGFLPFLRKISSRLEKIWFSHPGKKSEHAKFGRPESENVGNRGSNIEVTLRFGCGKIIYGNKKSREGRCAVFVSLKDPLTIYYPSKITKGKNNEPELTKAPIIP